MSVTLPPEQKRRRRKRDAEGLEFLPAALEIMETPPRPLGRWLAVIVALFFVAAVAWAAFSPVDIVSVANGKVVPDGQIKVLQPLRSGVITSIKARSGDHVNAGDVLVTLDATEARTDLERAELESAHARLNHAIATALLTNAPLAKFSPPDDVDDRLVALARETIHQRWQNQQSALAENSAQHRRILAQIASLSSEESADKDSLAEYRDLDQTGQQLDKVGLATRSQLANLKLQLISAKNELQDVHQRLEQAKLDLSANKAKRQQLVAQFKTDVTGQLSDARQSILIANQESNRLKEREDLTILRAPASGVVNQINVHTIGAVVSPSQTLMTVVPDDVALVIEATLQNRDIGFVEVGQPAEIKLEAFPFTHFGVIHGKVTEISADAIVDKTLGPVFTVRVKPDADSLVNSSRQIRLGPGMRATAEIKTGKRTVLEYFLTPLLQYKDEAIRER